VGEVRLPGGQWSAVARGGWTRNGLKILADAVHSGALFGGCQSLSRSTHDLVDERVVVKRDNSST
jgi:hypothetical protein